MAESYIQKNPLDGRGYFTIGYAYHRQGNHGPAVPYFEKALELSPEYNVTHHFFGECLFLLGEMDTSRAQHEAYRAAVPTEPDALYGIGLVDLEESKLEVAKARFREAIALYDKMKKTNRRLYDGKRVGLARCHARLADVYFAQDHYEAARDELIKTTTISPGTISALYTLSVVYRRLGEDQLADETLRRYEAAKAQIIKRQRGRGE
jgi:tetratricopeptide (TPR) repeat protein